MIVKTNELLENERLISAVSVLESTKAKNVFMGLAALFPECSIFWTEDSAILENDDIRIEVS